MCCGYLDHRPFFRPGLGIDRFLAIISGEPTSGDGDDIVLRSERLYGFWDVLEDNRAMTMVLGNESCTVSRKLDRGCLFKFLKHPANKGCSLWKLRRKWWKMSTGSET